MCQATALSSVRDESDVTQSTKDVSREVRLFQKFEFLWRCVSRIWASPGAPSSLVLWVSLFLAA
jgi:hypothetical protein